ncbi:MAG: Uma2 family endonuclease [Candidatus Brocadiaceae bacterium]|nr:Uma2 family endonuclease [Candidatus Brocadiaceae bacterium]
MSQTITGKKRYTYEDYLKTPDDKRYELINGELLMTPSPIPKHQLISGRLEFKLRGFVKENKFGEVFYAPCDVYLDDENVVQPDILFISKNRLNIIGEKNIQGAPDLAIEILSDYSVYRDTIQKKRLYARFGVKEYWIVIPEEEEIEVYILKDNTYQLYCAYKKVEELVSPSLKGLKIELKEIF